MRIWTRKSALIQPRTEEAELEAELIAGALLGDVEERPDAPVRVLRRTAHVETAGAPARGPGLKYSDFVKILSNVVKIFFHKLKN